jgi:hypothetical protein
MHVTIPVSGGPKNVIIQSEMLLRSFMPTHPSQRERERERASFPCGQSNPPLFCKS